MIKPDVYTHTGKIIDSIYKAGFQIGKMKMTRCNQSNASRLMAGDADSAQFLCSDVVTGL